MLFDGYDSMELTPSNGFGFVYVLCWKQKGKEVPFYVGQTQAIWGRMNDYHWAEFQANTDFRVGQAVRYLAEKKLSVVVKYKQSAPIERDRVKEEQQIISILKNDGRTLLNHRRTPYEYSTDDPEAVIKEIRKVVDEILASAQD